MASFSTLHLDIIRTHILTRLDGPALAAIAGASTRLRALSAEEKLWQEICMATWNSINHPRVREVISTFPYGHRSFFSDSFPILDHSHPSRRNDHDRWPGMSSSSLISAVDMYYKNKVIFSGVRATDTSTDSFLTSPFRVELLDPKEPFQTPIQHSGGDMDSWLKHIEEKLSLSWILIDPSGKRAANLSTRRPVLVEWPCTAGAVRLHYTTIVAGSGEEEGSGVESVECGLVVTCSGVEEGGEVQLEGTRLHLKGMDGRILNGRDSLVILHSALKDGLRKKGEGADEEGKGKYEEFVKRKEEMKEKEQRRERTLDKLHFGLTVCIVFWVCLVMVVYC